MQTAFQVAKEALCQASTLVHPDSTADPSLMVEAPRHMWERSCNSENAVRQRGSRSVFISHKLAAVQTRYSDFDWELLAIYSGIRYFRYMRWKGGGSLYSLITNR
jgi:hypothetical protein